MGNPSKGKILVNTNPPTPEQQIEFLVNIQRLLSEGSFVATYKYALLLALADLSIEKGQDDGSSLTLTTSEIAEKIINYYWRQCLPFGSAQIAAPVLLKQNTGKTAAILGEVEEAASKFQGSIDQLRKEARQWKSLVSSVKRTVEVMPLWRLQRVGNEVVDFLYPNEGGGSSIDLRPGVAFCFRKYYGLIGDLVRGAWVRYVRRFNPDVFGTVADLREFLFGSERANLKKVAAVLVEVQKGECFYCDGRVGAGENNVDHFIPWSRYPVDLGHNFVLAHGTCNGAKSDMLASVPHLRKWVNRNTNCGDQLVKGFESVGIVHHLQTSSTVARWAYNQAAGSAGQTWIKAKNFEPLAQDWEDAFTASIDDIH
jgi:hypothetical protein